MGTDRLYGRADWDIPLLKNKVENIHTEFLFPAFFIFLLQPYIQTDWQSEITWQIWSKANLKNIFVCCLPTQNFQVELVTRKKFFFSSLEKKKKKNYLM